MSSKRPFESALCRARGGFCLLVGVTLLTAQVLRGAEADTVVLDKPGSARALQEKGARQAEALAHFMTGLFEEESAGPDKAIESKRQVLALDPTCTDLAIELSYEYLRRGDTVQATGVLKDAISAAPRVVAPYLVLSAIYLRHLQKPDLAARYAQKALEIDGGSFEPYEMLWEVYQTQGQAARASQVLEKAARSKSRDPQFWLALAELYAGSLPERTAPSAETFAKISQYATEAAKYGDSNPDIQSRIGDLYVACGKVEEALPFYKNVLENKPSYPNIREKLAAAYIETDQADPAIVLLEEIIRDNPLNLAAYERLSKLHVKTGNYAKALAPARQALIIEGSIEHYNLVIGLLNQLKRYDEMAATLGDARKRFPMVAQLTRLYAVALSQARRHDEAMRAFEQAQVEAANSQPQILDGDFYFDYGAAAEQAGRYGQAADLFRKSITLDPANAARAYNYLGYMWVERGENLSEAETYIRRAVEMDSANGAYIDSLGWLYYKQGRYDEALTQLLRAAELLEEPDSVVFGHIGDAYAQLGKTAEAILYWQKSLQLDPGNKEIIAKVDKASERLAQQPDRKPNANK